MNLESSKLTITVEASDEFVSELTAVLNNSLLSQIESKAQTKARQ